MALPAAKLYLSSIAAGIGGYRLLPEQAGDFTSTLTGIVALPAVSGIGDIDGDGIPEVVVGAPGSDDKAVDAGRIYIVMGRGAGAASKLSDPVTDITIDGDLAGDLAGAVVGSIADMNGDGRADILIGAPLADRGATVDPGFGFVIWSPAAGGGVDLNDPATGGGDGFVMRGEAAQDRAGSAMASIADLNGDGRMDVLIGAPGNNAGGADAGSAYVVFGRTAQTPVNLTNVAAGTGGFRIVGEAAGDGAGSALASVADMNGDGLADIIVGASGNDAGGSNAGAVYVVFGKSTTAGVSLATLGGSGGGFRIVGAAAGALTGSTVSGLGDVNGDGLGDILIGAPGRDRAYVVFGKSGTADVLLADVEAGIGGFAILGEHAGDLSALTVAGGGDFNKDGILDLVIGTPRNNEGGANAGAVYVVWGGGHATVDLSLVAAGIGGAKIVGSAGSRAGSSVAVQADMTGDGRPELLIGAPGSVEAVSVVFAHSSWVPDITVYGSSGDDVIGPGYGGYHQVGDGADDIVALGGNDTVDAAGGADIVDGGDGDDSIDGGLGDDTILGGNGNDTLIGNDGADTLDGGTGTDTLSGGDGDDSLNGGSGADAMDGGAGNDTYTVDNAGDTITESSGTDTVIASVNWTLAAGLENLQLVGAAHHGTGNGADNIITGGTGNDTLLGRDGNDTLYGGGGADTLDGGAGADIMDGGAGDDSYTVDDPGDSVIEAAGGGYDTVVASVDWTLAANVEALTLTGAAHAGTGNDLDNVMTGQAGSDTLDGGAGNDTLDGGAGADLMIGGDGDDTYYVDDLNDVVQETPTGGTDLVIASVDWVAAANVEQVRLTGAAHVITGNALANTLIGGSGDDTLDGDDGDDTLLGGDGDDELVSGSGSDVLAGGSGDDRYVVKGGRAHIEDQLGHDTLDASEASGDSYLDLSGDTVSRVEDQDCELGQGGTTVLPLDVQFLQDLTGSFADDIATVRGLVPGIISALQTVQPNSRFGSSTFVDKPVSPFGAAGEWVYETRLAQTSSASALASTYNAMVTRNGMDAPEAQLEALMQLSLRTTEVGFRADSARFVVLFTDAPFHMAGDGAAGGILTPNNGDAIIDGTPAGTGEDYPLVAQVKSALEAANIIPIFAIAGGYEATYQGLAAQLGRGTVVTLTSNSSNVVAAVTSGLTAATVTTIEDAIGGDGNDTIKGNHVDNVLTGNRGNDTLEGDAGDDTLYGGVGHDILRGGTGADLMIGGTGNDTYYVDDLGDVTQEAPNAGMDTVIASVDWTLAPNIEVLQLAGGAVSGIGNDLANRITASDVSSTLDGADGNDRLTGGLGDDTLIGGTGQDLLVGGGGNDTYYVDDAGDLVKEAGGSGTDTVIASVDWTLGSNLEVLMLTGPAFLGTGNTLANSITASDNGGKLLGLNGADTLNGGAGSDWLDGGTGNDTLLGGGGGDVLIGGAGRDILTGGEGADAFRFTATNEGPDTITDFNPLEDLLEFSALAFGFTAEADLLAEHRLVLGNQATEAFGQLVYNSRNGTLAWDANGTDAGGRVVLATLTNLPVLTGTEFHVVA
ncbi:MAG: hypothetical protein AB7F35_03750 [Acetobacteraceae bacterium]